MSGSLKDLTAMAVKQSIYEISSTAKMSVGTRLQLGDRVFRYAKDSGSGLVAGTVVAVNMTNAVHELLSECTVAIAGAIGDKKLYITIGATTLTAGQLAGGYLRVAGASTSVLSGNTYKIKNNDAFTSAGSGYIYLYDALVAIVAVTAKVSVYPNPYSSVKTQTAAIADAGIALGVPLVTVTASHFCWLQTWGPVGVITENSAVAENQPVVHGGATAGAVKASSASTDASLGWVMVEETTNWPALVYLRLAP